MEKRSKSTCPVSYSLDVLGDKWTLLILRDVLIHDKHQYRDFLNAGEGIATNILATRLQKLLDEGLLVSEDDPENKTQTLYSATKKARELMPVLVEMAKWGVKHGDKRKLPPQARRHLS